MVGDNKSDVGEEEKPPSPALAGWSMLKTPRPKKGPPNCLLRNARHHVTFRRGPDLGNSAIASPSNPNAFFSHHHHPRHPSRWARR